MKKGCSDTFLFCFIETYMFYGRSSCIVAEARPAEDKARRG